jgi:hypothetical protein
LDFNVGLEFQVKIRRRFHAPVHHPSSSHDGSFFLLATFRRFLFCLTEESVSLTLESCLGGKASDFHVKFLSNNHFRFSVFSKDVGFEIYRLHRVITSSFDIYFHLWSNGTPNWENVKRAWEIEQEKEWTYVLSKSTKRALKKQENATKCVRFAEPIIQPPRKQPPIILTFGSFTNCFDPVNLGKLLVFASSESPTAPVSYPIFETRVHRFPQPDLAQTVKLRSRFSNSSFVSSQNAVSCSRCVSLAHARWACSSQVACANRFSPGHVKAFAIGPPILFGNGSRNPKYYIF